MAQQLYAEVVGGTVAQVVRLPDGITPAMAFGAALAPRFVLCTDAVGQGWTHDADRGFAAPVPVQPAVPVPDVISDRQCFQQLAAMDKITQDEALAAVSTGALPKAVSDGIAGLPAAQQFPAQMLICGATEFHRQHPMVPVFLGFFGLGEADRDPLWTAAAAL